MIVTIILTCIIVLLHLALAWGAYRSGDRLPMYYGVLVCHVWTAALTILLVSKGLK